MFDTLAGVSDNLPLVLVTVGRNVDAGTNRLPHLESPCHHINRRGLSSELCSRTIIEQQEL